MSTPQGRDLLAHHTRERRKQLGLSQEALAVCGGPSTATVRKIEHADDADWESTTLRRLDAGLDWEPGTAASLLYGTSTEPRLRGRGPVAPAVPVRTASGLWDDRSPGLPADVRRSLERLADGVSFPGEESWERHRAAS